MTLLSPESVGYRCEEVPDERDGVRAYACTSRDQAADVPATESSATPAGAGDEEGTGAGVLASPE